jgi:heterotetrameric sarcosine oxidase gamma subunit
VASQTPIARGPYPSVGATRVEGNWEVSSGPTGDLTITDLTRLAKWTVRADADSATAASLPPAGSLVRANDTLQVAGAPGEWLVVAAPDSASGVEGAAVRDVDDADEVARRALLRLTGTNARDLLAKICALNLSDKACPDGTSTRSQIGGIVTDLARDDVSGTLSFLLHSERSASRSLLTALLDAGHEFGVVFAGTGAATP